MSKSWFHNPFKKNDPYEGMDLAEVMRTAYPINPEPNISHKNSPIVKNAEIGKIYAIYENNKHVTLGKLISKKEISTRQGQEYPDYNLKFDLDLDNLNTSYNWDKVMFETEYPTLVQNMILTKVQNTKIGQTYSMIENGKIVKLGKLISKEDISVRQGQESPDYNLNFEPDVLKEKWSYNDIMFESTSGGRSRRRRKSRTRKLRKARKSRRFL